MSAEDDAVAAMAQAFADDANLIDEIKDNLADVTYAAYLDTGTPNDSAHALRVIIRGVLAYFGPDGRLVPPKAIMSFNLSSADLTTYFTSGLGITGSPYANWAICNGSNGTPDLRDKFIRSTDGAAGGTGGSDSHDHTVNSHDHTMSHDHSTPNHSHQTEIGWDSGNTLYMKGDDPASGSILEPIVTRHTASIGAVASASARLASTRTDGGDTTGGSSSSNTGNATPGTNSQSNIPAYTQLTFLMRVA